MTRTLRQSRLRRTLTAASASVLTLSLLTAVPAVADIELPPAEGHGTPVLINAVTDAGIDEEAPTVSANLLGRSTGEFAPMDHGHGTSNLTVEGTATMVKTATGTSVTIVANGLLPGNRYPAHLHEGSCSDHGGHYMHDPAGPAAPPNEIWVSSTTDPRGDLQPNSQRVARGWGSADWIVRQQPLSVMIHESGLPGLPIVCADFAAYDAPASLVLTADDGDGSGIDTVEYRIDGGGWLTYASAVAVSEPGAHTVEFRATDVAGNTSPSQELTFAVAGEDPDPGPVVVVPPAVTFADEDGTANDFYTVPTVEGVEYLVDGVVVEAGSYQGAGTVTVTARAVEGFVLAEGATMQWSHTFDAGGDPQQSPVSAEADTRCVVGRVVEVVKVTNESATPVEVVITMAYGSRTATLAPSTSVAAAFSTRVGSLPAGEGSVMATDVDGDVSTVTVPYTARSCG